MKKEIYFEETHVDLEFLPQNEENILIAEIVDVQVNPDMTETQISLLIGEPKELCYEVLLSKEILEKMIEVLNNNFRIKQLK